MNQSENKILTGSPDVIVETTDAQKLVQIARLVNRDQAGSSAEYYNALQGILAGNATLVVGWVGVEVFYGDGPHPAFGEHIPAKS